MDNLLSPPGYGSRWRNNKQEGKANMNSKTVMRSGVSMITLAVTCMVLSMAPWANAQQRTTGTPSGTSQVVESVTKTQMLSLMKAEGYAVETDSDGDIVWKIDGFRTFMFVSKDGASLQLFASFGDGNATLKKVNEWNKSKMYSRTYLDEDGDPCLELDLDMAGGVTVARIKDFLKTCRVSYQAWFLEVVK
jgi:hypothetical protein